MWRTLMGLVVLGAAVVACTTAWQNRLTPSGQQCSDMPIYPAGQAIERPYHRLQPVSSRASLATEAQRLESLRSAACAAGADAVIEAANEETPLDGGATTVVASGTAVVWTSRPQAK